MKLAFLAAGLLALAALAGPKPAHADPTCNISGEAVTWLGASRGIGCSGASPVPTVGTCGTGPALDANASNHAGTVTIGTGTITACTVTFGSKFYAKVPHCIVALEAAASTATVYVSAVSAAAFTATFSADSSTQAFDYICVAR